MAETISTIEAGHLIGAYRFMEMIGKGGFSEVWSALDTRLNRLVAIKIIPIDDGIAGESAIQFRREALIVTRLEHHHILPLYDFGEEASFRYLVMRYVTGGSLANRVKGRTPLDPGELFRLMAPMAATLDYIHEKRIVHRDIKPGNILFDAQDVPYLADFGLAKELSENTQQLHSTAGTPVYMPPEQFRGENLSILSDQYSLGILLFQLFTGTVPYNGEHSFGLRQLVSDDVLPDVRTINPELPSGLNALLQALTALKPAERPANASQVIKAMTGLFSGLNSPVTVEAVPTLVFALESGAYRKREAELLLEKYLPNWRTDLYTLSRTHFILLDMIFGATPDLLTSEARSLMLRGAFETGLQLDVWWARASDAERKRAAWHALNSADAAIRLRALERITPMPWANEASSATLNQIAVQMLPLSDFTAPALTFLEKALPQTGAWRVDSTLSTLDETLHVLAVSHGPFADRAAHLIGAAYRTQAALTLPMKFRDVGPLLSVYESAGSLPKERPLPQIALLTLMLAVRQLTAHPLAALRQYLWADVGNGLGLAVMVFVVYRSITLVDNVRILNTLGQGFIFGAIYGLGVWSTRHIMRSLRIAAQPLRMLLAILVGSLVLSFGFSIYHKLVYDDTLDFITTVGCGLLYVAGFILTTEMPRVIRVIGSAAGVAAAYLIPWWLYMRSASVIQPPFFFDESNALAALPLAIISALILAAVTYGDLWLPAPVPRNVHDNARPPGSENLVVDTFETTRL